VVWRGKGWAIISWVLIVSTYIFDTHSLFTVQVSESPPRRPSMREIKMREEKRKETKARHSRISLPSSTTHLSTTLPTIQIHLIPYAAREPVAMLINAFQSIFHVFTFSSTSICLCVSPVLHRNNFNRFYQAFISSHLLPSLSLPLFCWLQTFLLYFSIFFL
jgi:hypothetical protein